MPQLPPAAVAAYDQDYAVTVPIEDLGKLTVEHLPIPRALAQELFDKMFRHKRWMHDPEGFIVWFQRYRRRCLESAKLTRATRKVGAGTEWVAKAKAKHAENPAHWVPGRLAAMFGRSREEVEAIL